MIEEWRLIDNNFYISKEQKLKQKEAIQLWWKKRKEGDVI